MSKRHDDEDDGMAALGRAVSNTLEMACGISPTEAARLWRAAREAGPAAVGRYAVTVEEAAPFWDFRRRLERAHAADGACAGKAGSGH